MTAIGPVHIEPPTSRNAQAYREASWSDLVVLQPGQELDSWEYERQPEKKGGCTGGAPIGPTDDSN